ncbi:hypothetical protein E4U21_003977 [Claviceps maximensis]|nr:hypothetical protein E4U21_003977 [Claviceps maximensis]
MILLSTALILSPHIYLHCTSPASPLALPRLALPSPRDPPVHAAKLDCFALTGTNLVQADVAVDSGAARGDHHSASAPASAPTLVSAGRRDHRAVFVSPLSTPGQSVIIPGPALPPLPSCAHLADCYARSAFSPIRYSSFHRHPPCIAAGDGPDQQLLVLPQTRLQPVSASLCQLKPCAGTHDQHSANFCAAQSKRRPPPPPAATTIIVPFNSGGSSDVISQTPRTSYPNSDSSRL